MKAKAKAEARAEVEAEVKARVERVEAKAAVIIKKKIMVTTIRKMRMRENSAKMKKLPKIRLR